MKKNVRGPLILFMAGAAADQALKMAIRHWVTEPVTIFGGFAFLETARNYGFSFGLGSGMPAGIRIAFQLIPPLAVISFAAFRLFRGRPSFAESYGLAAYCAGALGNWIDRALNGYVLDFIRIRTYGLFGLSYWPTMNLADLFISAGAVIFIASQLFSAPKAGKTAGSIRTDEHEMDQADDHGDVPMV